MKRAEWSDAHSELTAIGEQVWERVMDGDPTASEAYAQIMKHESTMLGLNPSEGVAALHG